MILEEAVLRKDEDRTDWERRSKRDVGMGPKKDPDEGSSDWSKAEIVTPVPRRLFQST